MNPVAAAVLYLVFWFMTLFVILPLRLKTQGESGDVAPGTSSSAPENPNLKRKFRLVTIVATALWIPVVFVIYKGWITVEDIDVFNRCHGLPCRGTGGIGG